VRFCWTAFFFGPLVDVANHARIERLAWLDVLDDVLNQRGTFGIEIM